MNAGCRAKPATTSALSRQKRKRSPSCPSFRPATTATDSTTWMPTSRHRSMTRIFTSRMSRPHVPSYTSPVRPSNDRYTPVSPTSSSRYPSRAAMTRPFVLTSMPQKPFSRPMRMISGKSLRHVGSPPVICTAPSVPTAFAMTSYMSEISASVGSPSPVSALMKHTGQCRLQLRVTSISSSVPRRWWRLHVPQPCGHGAVAARVFCGAVIGNASERSHW